MPNIIPPIVSSSPPPLDPIDDDNDEDENDDFGDFAAADFASHPDSAVPTTISDTSWALPSLKHIPTKSEPFENGLESASEDTLPQTHTEVLDDDEILQNADNTSHDSVVSAVTDSGNCSASQNSNGTSPMPNVEGEEEMKSEVCHSYQNGSACQLSKDTVSTGSVQEVCIPDANQLPSDFSETDNVEDRTCDVSFKTSVDGLCQQSTTELQDTLASTLTNKLAGKVLSELTSVSQENNSYTETQEPSINAENQQTVEESSIIPKTTTNNDLNSDEFGVWRSDNVPIENFSDQERKNDEDCNDKQSTESSEEKSPASYTESTSNIEEVLRRKLDSFNEEDYVRGMIIPDMPCFEADDDDDEDEDFGEFSGMASPAKCSSGEQSVDPQFQSPSRRPTLVLSDDVPEIDNIHQQLSTVNEIKNSFEQPSNENFSSFQSSSNEVNTTGVCSNIESNSNSTFSFNPSGSDDPFDDEFADFTQAEVDVKAAASDVWAQAAQASSIQSALPPEDPSEVDDFDDFESAEFQSVNVSSKSLPAQNSYFDLNAIRSNFGEVLKENFPVGDGNCSYVDTLGTSGVSGIVLDVEESPIWQGLRDLEATPSLSFQWPGSHSNRGLLGALNIDSRNILFGPKWNTVVPRFAANLGFSPLEPVRAAQNQPPSEPSPRTEMIEPTVVETIKPSSSSEQGFQEVVPAAQFDWSDSGLTNPLDSNKDPSTGALATTAASGNPVLTTTPLQVEQLLAASKRSTPLGSLEKKNRDPTLSPEAVRVLDTLPELAFLSARMLMFPVQGDRNENKL